MSWSVHGTKAVDKVIGFGFDDSVEVVGDELAVHTMTENGSYNVHLNVKIPKDVLLQLLANAGWLPK